MDEAPCYFAMKRYRPIVLCMLIGSWAIAKAQASKEQFAYRRAFARAAVVTRLGLLQAGNDHPAIAAKAFQPTHSAEQRASMLARRLKGSWDRKGIPMAATQLLADGHCVALLAQYYRYQLTKALPKVHDPWLYSEATVPYLGAPYQPVYLQGIARLADLLPSSLSNRAFLGLYLWPYVFMLALLLLCSITYKLLHWVLESVIHHFAKRWAYQGTLAIAGPLSTLLVALLVIITIPAIQLPRAVERCFSLLSQGLIAFSLTCISYRLVDLLAFYIHQHRSQQQNQVLVYLLPLLRKTAKVLVVSIGAVFILQRLHFDTRGLLAGFSIGGLGLALASQDTLKNLFGSLMILVDKPCGVGDTIVSGAIEGKIEEVGFRSTRLRTAQDSVVYVPNAKLADAYIDNYGLRRYRRFFTRLEIAYDTPSVLLATFIEGLRKLAHQHRYVVKDRCFIYLHELQASGLQIIFRVYFCVTDYRNELQSRHELLMAIIKLAEDLGIRFA